MSDRKIIVTPLKTDEDRTFAIKAALSSYLGEQCKYCDKRYENLNDLRTVVWAGYHERGRLACKACWDTNNPPQEPMP